MATLYLLSKLSFYARLDAPRNCSETATRIRQLVHWSISSRLLEQHWILSLQRHETNNNMAFIRKFTFKRQIFNATSLLNAQQNSSATIVSFRLIFFHLFFNISEVPFPN